MYDLIIKGNAVLSDRVLYDAVVAVKDGRIAAVLPPGTNAEAKERIDATGRYVLPGAIDAHVHCYSSLDEGFTKASRSAAAGGVTTIIEMPYDATGMICTEELFLAKKEVVERESVVDIALLATIAKQDGLDQIPLLARAGACGFKVSMFNTDSFRFPRIDDGELLEAFAAIAETGCPVGVHAEVDEIVRKAMRKQEAYGERDPRSHCWSRPKVAESTAVLTALELAHWTGVKLHIYHCTFPRIFDLVHYFKKQGTRVTAETCTHYLTLSEDDLLTLHAKGKINPPLRSREDVEQLWQQIARGEVDMVTSDHAPWLIERKNKPNIFENASGAPGVEHLLPVMYSEGVAAGRISIVQLAHLLAEKPASVFGLDSQKGRIAEGLDADLVILDPQQSWVIDEAETQSSAGWSPYHGMQMQGRITHAFLRGQAVYDGTVVGQPGMGRFVHAVHR
ncbi:MAG: dihydroorotase family protein [Tumebacillaceae bacterium]